MHMHVTINSGENCATVFTKTLNEEEGKLARTLVGGHPPSIANAVLRLSAVREEIFNYFMLLVNNECTKLCKNAKDEPVSYFCKFPVNQLCFFKWDIFIPEMELKCPLLLKILTTVTSRVDHRYVPTFCNNH